MRCVFCSNFFSCMNLILCPTIKIILYVPSFGTEKHIYEILDVFYIYCLKLVHYYCVRNKSYYFVNEQEDKMLFP